MTQPNTRRYYFRDPRRGGGDSPEEEDVEEGGDTDVIGEHFKEFQHGVIIPTDYYEPFNLRMIGKRFFEYRDQVR